MSHGSARSVLFDIEATADTTYEPYDWGSGGAVSAVGANDTVYTVSTVTLINDDATEVINFVLDGKRGNTISEIEALNRDHNLKPGETFTADVRCNTLWIKCLANTALFRAMGTG